ncbi:hypothetical protein JOB18_029558 [Solea senegalensis]|uniref:Uncharacterized protein n=1 Tax=Solea senegalensis TaxID=28829 RepID=A0AAV6SJR6_SOLSE|nr:hypothetical protein JOB18_029558 [Solea senegalensis]
MSTCSCGRQLSLMNVCFFPFNFYRIDSPSSAHRLYLKIDGEPEHPACSGSHLVLGDVIWSQTLCPNPGIAWAKPK